MKKNFLLFHATCKQSDTFFNSVLKMGIRNTPPVDESEIASGVQYLSYGMVDFRSISFLCKKLPVFEDHVVERCAIHYSLQNVLILFNEKTISSLRKTY